MTLLLEVVCRCGNFGLIEFGDSEFSGPGNCRCQAVLYIV